jgi:hypothetical protein
MEIKKLSGQDYVQSLNDLELKIAGEELTEFYKNSILPNGKVKELAGILAEEIDVSFSLKVAEDMVLREILNRFCSSVG